MAERSARRARRVALAAMAVAALGVVAAVTGVGHPAAALPAETDVVAQAGATTSTLPEDNRTFGDIVPAPNSGRAPESPGDPGGWLQVSLFFILCGTVTLMAGIVWWQSRRARARREAEGRDPVSLARARGEGLRKPPRSGQG